MRNMSGENVCDDFTSSDTKGERHEGLEHWPPCPQTDFSAVWMVSARSPSPSGRCEGCEMRNGCRGVWEEGGFGSDMSHRFKITRTLLEG